ncbi:MAG: amidohydrolase family protein, partial [Atopobiaceae bacterium]|nr:amidohydrolase family protein [Atopobiaceae bacterium]
MCRTRIVNARVVTPHGVCYGGVVFDEGGIIAVEDAASECCTAGLDDAGLITIDADGAWLVPGGIDPHVHFGGFGDIPIADDFRTGSLGALAGGTTTVMDFCEPT